MELIRCNRFIPGVPFGGDILPIGMGGGGGGGDGGDGVAFRIIPGKSPPGKSVSGSTGGGGQGNSVSDKISRLPRNDT